MANAVSNQVKFGITQNQLDYVSGQLEEKKEKGLCFPESYSIRNAMQSAFLMLKDAEDKDGNSLVSVCTQESIVQSLMQMATQGLNPIKKQCYFVAYGNKCKLVPSYFGTLAILNRVKNLKRQPVANVVREGDVFEYGYDMDTLEMKIHKHETSLENLDKPVIAAYAVIETDKERVVEIMSRKQLEASWAQGQSWKSAKKRGYESATHKNFSEEMAKKTVLNRASKKLINATDDSSIMNEEGLQAFNEVENNDNLDLVAEKREQDVKDKANATPFPEVETVEGEIVSEEEVEEVMVEVVEEENSTNTDSQEEDVPDWAK